MSNCVFGWPIYSSDVGMVHVPVLSGGSWAATLPLTNVLTARPKRVARSTDALAASTQFDIDLGVARDLRVFAILVRNATAAATVRFRVSNVAGAFGAPVYDSTAVLILPAGVSAEGLEGMNVWKTIVAPANQNGRYIRVEIADAANPDGYVDVGRVITAAGWQSSINMAPGAMLGVEDLSITQETDGGSDISQEKPTRRVWKFGIEDLPEAEAMGNALDMNRIARTTRQVHFVFDPADVAHMHRRAFLGRLRTLGALEHPYLVTRSNIGYEIAEAL